ncbi:uncharacterized protein LOC111375973 [Olea europaea var. sylvestris]|uniref:uncharacterized protein LOC111375973 n=1 Tax=Olea europaea var. sylvestris TaxID=158386 RepID=UPI000C1D68B4|nr:uncharacterized protein LOC111375973 [Olea europaea var. sylvestris]
MSLHVFMTLFQPTVIGKESKGWYYLTPWEGLCTFCGGAAFFHKGVEGVVVLGEGQVASGGGRQSSVLHNSSVRFELSREEFEVIEDIYKRPLKLRHFDHLIDRSRYFLDFELMASKDKFKMNEYPAPDMASILRTTSHYEGEAPEAGHPRASKEETPQRPEKAKEPQGKEKVVEDPKKKKLVHISSSSGKFRSSMSQGKEVGPSKLLEATSKVVKIEMVRRAEADEAREEAARRQAEVAGEEAAKEKPVRVQGKSPSFLANREEPLAQLWEALIDFQTRTTTSGRKIASLAEELKAARAEVEVSRAEKLEESAKLESALAQIEALKREVHESQCEVASLTKKVEVSNDHQKWYVDDATHAREEAQSAREEAVRDYIANFHNTEEYKSFSTYWRNFAYAEVMERAEELSEFVDEVPQTPADEVVEDEVVEAEEANSDAQAAKVPAAEVPPPSSQAYDSFLFSYA